MSQAEIQWERVLNFGKHSHILRDGKTLCGRDVSQNLTKIQANPTKKCQRCEEYQVALKIDPLYRTTKFSTSPFF